MTVTNGKVLGGTSGSMEEYMMASFSVTNGRAKEPTFGQTELRTRANFLRDIDTVRAPTPSQMDRCIRVNGRREITTGWESAFGPTDGATAASGPTVEPTATAWKHFPGALFDTTVCGTWTGLFEAR